MLTGGRHVAPVALLFIGNSAHVGKAVPPEVMTTVLQDALYDCDWMPYDVFEQDTKLEGKEINLSGESYKILIVPPVEVIPYGTLEKAEKFFEAGGVVLGYGFLPSKSATLGRTGKEIIAMTEAVWGANPRPGLGVKKVSAAGGRSYLLPERPTVKQIRRVLAGDAGVRPELEVLEGKTDNWLHVLHRVKSGRDVFFIANQNLEGGARSFKLRVRAPGEPEQWDAMRNEVTAVEYQRVSRDEVEVKLTLEPYESALLVFQDQIRPLPMRLLPDAKVKKQIPVQIDESVIEPPSPKLKAPEVRHWWDPRAKLTLSPVKANPFSGKAEIPADLDLKKNRVYLVCDNIFPEAAARVTVNGMYAGGFIERPLRLELSRFLKPGNNTIRIEPFAPRKLDLEVFGQ
jgi:hypothetical protein